MENAFQFPSDFKRLIGNLSDENQWRILECLLNNENKVKYSTIQKTLDIPKGTLNYHLKELQKGGWLRRWSQKGSKFESDDGSFYEINQFGLKILEGGLKAMNKKSYQKSHWPELLSANDSISKKQFRLAMASSLNWHDYILKTLDQSKIIYPIVDSVSELKDEPSPKPTQFISSAILNQTDSPLHRRKLRLWT